MLKLTFKPFFYLSLLLLFCNLSHVHGSSILRVMPINEYKCIYRELDWSSPYVIEYGKRHFNFAINNTPPSLPVGRRGVYCHEILRYGQDDSPLYPRLEQKLSFYLWDIQDPSFSDRDINGVLEINDEITEEFRKRTGANNTNLNLFYVFQWQDTPHIVFTNSSKLTSIGVLMTPFIDGYNRGHCPSTSDYEGNNILYQILGERVAIDTEALYMSESELQVSPSGKFLVDKLLIRESDLKSAWFYFEGGIHMTPDQNTVETKTIHFYYPINKKQPYIKHKYQTLYTVRFPDQIGINVGIPCAVRAPDKRFACIPKL